jgi:hypothetical protein
MAGMSEDFIASFWPQGVLFSKYENTSILLGLDPDVNSDPGADFDTLLKHGDHQLVFHICAAVVLMMMMLSEAKNVRRRISRDT